MKKLAVDFSSALCRNTTFNSPRIADAFECRWELDFQCCSSSLSCNKKCRDKSCRKVVSLQSLGAKIREKGEAERKSPPRVQELVYWDNYKQGIWDKNNRIYQGITSSRNKWKDNWDGSFKHENRGTQGSIATGERYPATTICKVSVRTRLPVLFFLSLVHQKVQR